MPLRKVLFLKDNFYHIYNRGNRKAQIFFEDKDYLRFLEKAEKYRQKYPVEVICFCLLPNHFHFILKQNSDVLISRFMGTLLNSYARYASVKYNLPPGHVFQGRFGSKLIKNGESLLQANRYIHLNPIKERILNLDFTNHRGRSIKTKSLLNQLRQYPWSSYQIYLPNPKTKSPLTINREIILTEFKSPSNYRRFIEAKISNSDILLLEDF